MGLRYKSQLYIKMIDLACLHTHEVSLFIMYHRVSWPYLLRIFQTKNKIVIVSIFLSLPKITRVIKI